MDEHLLNFNTNSQASLKFDKEDKPEFKGVACTMGTLNLNRVLLMPNCYDDNVVKSFNDRGFFLSWTHNNTTDPVAFPTSTVVSGYSLLVKGTFHSDDNSKKTYNTIKERVNANKYVGMSIGATGRLQYFSSGKEFYQFLLDTNADTSFLDLESFKDEEDYIYVCSKITNLEHVIFTLVPADVGTNVALEKLRDDAKISSNSNSESLELLSLRTQMLGRKI